jgi:hypothetical protein
VANNTVISEEVFSSPNGNDIVHFRNPSGQVVSWVDSQGFGQGNLAGGGSTVRAIQFLLNGQGSTPGTGVFAQISIPYACTIKGWVITADQTGSAVVDILRSTYVAFPTTSSIAGTDKPTLSGARKNEDLTLTGWGSTAINAGDILQANLNSVATVTQVFVTLNITVP